MLKHTVAASLLLLSTAVNAAEGPKTDKSVALISGYTYVSAFSEMQTRGVGMRMLRDLSDQLDLVVGVAQGKSRGSQIVIDNADYLVGVLYTPDRSRQNWYGGAHAGLQTQRIDVNIFEFEVNEKKLNAILQGEAGYRMELGRNLRAALHIRKPISSQELNSQSDDGSTVTYTDKEGAVLLGMGAEYQF